MVSAIGILSFGPLLSPPMLHISFCKLSAAHLAEHFSRRNAKQTRTAIEAVRSAQFAVNNGCLCVCQQAELHNSRDSNPSMHATRILSCLPLAAHFCAQCKQVSPPHMVHIQQWHVLASVTTPQRPQHSLSTIPISPTFGHVFCVCSYSIFLAAPGGPAAQVSWVEVRIL